MTAQPEVPGPDTGSYEVIHLGGQAAVVLPVADFLRLWALERSAAPQELEDAEDAAAILEWKAVTPPGRGRSSRPRKHGAGSACRGEPAGSTMTNGPSARPPRSLTTRQASARC
jgi:hypothetical protein